jgi:proline iminopeptidase
MRIEINGVRLFFDVEGAKLIPDGPAMREQPTLILLHGGPGFDHSYWKPEFSQLADVAQIIYLDQRGCGRSDDGPRASWTFAQWGDDVRALCDALDIERPIVCGSSFGAEVTMSYATGHPYHPAKIIILSGSARLNIDHIAATFERLGGPNAAAIARSFWTAMTPENAVTYQQTCVPLYFRNAWNPQRDSRAILRGEVTVHYLSPGGPSHTVDFRPALARIACPVLLIGGDDDPVTTIEDMEEIARAMPKHLVRLERIPNCGHGPYFDAPAQTLDLIRDFITS